MASASEHFFSTLPELSSFADVVDHVLYHPVPRDWHVVLTDVRGSTRAIEQGRYRDVNALGASSIIALRNALPDVELPFVFGGDGATLLVPSVHLRACEVALRGLRNIARETFDLELRCGTMPASTLLDQGLHLGVARYRASDHVVLAMFMGAGFAEAERRIKAETPGGPLNVSDDGEAQASLEGFECRWQPIASKRGSIVSLLVCALAGDTARKTEVYRNVLQQLQAVLGDGSGHPVDRSNLALMGPWGDFSIEARLRSATRVGSAYKQAFGEARKKAAIGKLLVLFGASAGTFDGEKYPLELIRNCDFRKFDETLRMVIDVSDAQVAALEAVLQQARALGHIAYGLHRAPSALMTCFVRSFAGDHLHFIDGANGGYALAAKQLKEQLKTPVAGA